MHTVTPIDKLVSIPAPEPMLKTTSDDDTFLIQKRYGSEYTVIGLGIAEGERVYAALAEWIDNL